MCRWKSASFINKILSYWISIRHDSSLVWHITHKFVFMITPLLLKHSLVGILPRRTLHAVVNTLGKVLIFHRYLNTSFWGLLSGLAIHSYAEFKENNPESSNPYTCISSCSLDSLAHDMCVANSVSNMISHSNLALLQLNFQLHTESNQAPTSSTFWFWFKESEKKV